MGRGVVLLGQERRDRRMDRRHGSRSRPDDPAAASRGPGRRMSTATSSGESVTLPDPPAGSRVSRFVWNFRHHPKRELWFAWWVMVIFYQLYGLLFFFVTRVQPPPSPAWDTPRSCVGSATTARASRRIRRRLPRRGNVRADERSARVLHAADVGESGLRLFVPDHLFARRGSRHAGDGHRDDCWRPSAGSRPRD